MNDLEKEAFIKENTSEWIKTGAKYKRLRMAYGLTMTKLSRMTGFSATKLGCFENGRPILNRRVVQRSYIMVLQIIKTEISKIEDESTIAI